MTLSQFSRNFDIRKLAACTHGDNKRERQSADYKPKEPFYILCGWMTEKDAKAFQNDISGDARIFCLIDENEQEDAHKTPPTKLKNPKLFKPFEMYTKMYGLPAYGEMDPTWFIALTYSFIFGAMFGDAGQGLVLLDWRISFFTSSSILTLPESSAVPESFPHSLASCSAASLDLRIL